MTMTKKTKMVLAVLVVGGVATGIIVRKT